MHIDEALTTRRSARAFRPPRTARGCGDPAHRRPRPVRHQHPALEDSCGRRRGAVTSGARGAGPPRDPAARRGRGVPTHRQAQGAVRLAHAQAGQGHVHPDRHIPRATRKPNGASGAMQLPVLRCSGRPDLHDRQGPRPDEILSMSACSPWPSCWRPRPAASTLAPRAPWNNYWAVTRRILKVYMCPACACARRTDSLRLPVRGNSAARGRPGPRWASTSRSRRDRTLAGDHMNLPRLDVGA